MEELLEQLKQARQAEQKAQELVEAWAKRLFATSEYEQLQNAKFQLEQAKEFTVSIDDAVRQCAIDIYKLSNDKHPHDKISIVINRTLHYQESDAFDWAGRNAPTMLKLDTKKFEKHARAVLETMPLDFVKVEEVPSVRIASEL